MKSTRRRILQYGLGGAALLAFGDVVRAVTRAYPLPANVPPPLCLSEKELAVVRAIVEAILPADADFPSGLELGVDRMIDEELYSQTPEFASDMKAALQLMEHAPPLAGTWGRLTELAPPERAAVLEHLARTGPDVVAQAAVVTRQLAQLYYFGDERTWAAIGYDGPWQKTPVPHASHARYLAALAARSGQAVTS